MSIGPKMLARYVGGLCMLAAVVVGVGWLVRLFLGETAAFVVAVFVLGFALFAYGLDGGGGGAGG